MKRRQLVRHNEDDIEIYLVFDNVTVRDKVLKEQKKNWCSHSLKLQSDHNEEF